MVNQTHALWRAKVFHKRFYPKVNAFAYKVFYTLLNMEQLTDKNNWLFSSKNPALLRYRDEDHGNRDGSSALEWAKKIFKKKNILVDSIYLLTIPRIYGYVFNPVSFWLGFFQGELYAVICEVNNTFGQTHSYICYEHDGLPIDFANHYASPKNFHVSPFYALTGYYTFRFDIKNKKNFWSIVIHYHDQDKLQLITSISGTLSPMSNMSILRELFRVPLMSFKVIFMIHYQALKLFLRKTKFNKMPNQPKFCVSEARKINKN